MRNGSRGSHSAPQAGGGAGVGSPSPERLSYALQAINRIAGEAGSVRSGLGQVLVTLCEEIGWPIGHVYQLAGDEQQTLTSAELWHLGSPRQFTEFQASSQAISFAPGDGLVGQVLARRSPGLCADVTRERRFLRRRAARASGLHAWIAFPVLVDGRVVAVCEFFSTEPVAFDEALIGLLGCAGLALGRLYERERWAAERERLQQQLAAMRPVAAAADHASLAALAAAIAHEVNSPLFAARASLALLAADRPDEPLIAGARADLGRIAAVMATLNGLAQGAPLGQRLEGLGGEG